MMDFRRNRENNEGNDGYIWSKRLVSLCSLSLTLAAAAVSLDWITKCGGFIGFGG